MYFKEKCRVGADLQSCGAQGIFKDECPSLLAPSSLSLSSLPLPSSLCLSRLFTSNLLSVHHQVTSSFSSLYLFWSLQTLDYTWHYVTISSLLTGTVLRCFPLYILETKMPNGLAHPFRATRCVIC